MDFKNELAKYGYSANNSIPVETLINEILPKLFSVQNENKYSEEEMIAFCEWVSETIPAQSNYLRNLRRFNRGENIPPEKLRGYYTTKQLLEKFKNKEL